MTVTTKLQTVSCYCGCGIIFLEMDAVLDDYDNPYLNLEHMAEDALTEYLDRYAFEAPDDL